MGTELHEKISTIECENKSLRKTVAELTTKVPSLEDNEDRQNQYIRRHWLRITGFRESPDESTDNIVISMCKSVGATISIDEIDRSHMVGKPKPAADQSDSLRPRDIIIKITNCRARQNSVYEENES
ncbi:hypothetical protein DPMN_095039 [Dreissena polymorpha]|uniref:Uncharacterized protein n=1 Tax=Dreissena polymorpha TaxID=45954 RepID=A0A9D4L762_DREPO|nr:hypothetical protein DPMN_095039 [Dreissena polymorpha]